MSCSQLRGDISDVHPSISAALTRFSFLRRRRPKYRPGSAHSVEMREKTENHQDDGDPSASSQMPIYYCIDCFDVQRAVRTGEL